MTGRGSKLSLLQMEKVKEKIEAVYPGITVQLITRESKGDLLQGIPLHKVEGTDFFTAEFFDALAKGEADIAVHSLKDMSSEHFFGENKFAVVDRDDIRDFAIFNNDIEEKIAKGETIVIGTCSPRREQMATVFLRKALPQLHNDIKIVAKPIRGNVETRLRKLDEREYDGTILATAGLNRLLQSNDGSSVKDLLANKKTMLLPLIECVPAPCQGAIVAEANPLNKKAVEILNSINNNEWMGACKEEKKTARNYGTGCLQQFGVTSISYGDKRIIYAAGRDSNGADFSKWSGLPELSLDGKKVFSSTERMGDFFEYEYLENIPLPVEEFVYVANYKAVKQPKLLSALKEKKVWAAGTKTWFELARTGTWVEGCADAFGLEFLLEAWQMPVLNISKNEVAIITNEQSLSTWKYKGWKVYVTYRLKEKKSETISEQIKGADVVFWTSYRQYVQYKDVLKRGVQHSCPFGETAVQLKSAGINPVVFPNIKAFMQWRQTCTP